MRALPPQKRGSGILAHITSLPSPYGIGDLGYSSHTFLEFLARAGQGHWQFLPTGPGNPVFDNSPYMSSSAFAGSPLLISPDLLLENGLIKESSLKTAPVFSEFSTDFPQVSLYKGKILQEAFFNFSPDSQQFITFKEDTPWLDDYSLFMVLKEEFQALGWFDWPAEIATRRPEALAALRLKHHDRMEYYAFEQFEFFRQWQILRAKARKENIKLIGDIPIYVGWDSVDVWANQEIFILDPESLRPIHVAGVPPDYFSATGQRWGNPLYKWQSSDENIQKKLTNWWIERFRTVFQMVDTARIDHFRGFEAYWSIPEEEETAIEGEWLKGPGKLFFDKIFSALGPLDIIAEDLGIITQEVTILRRTLGFPGMKVLQFAFDDNPDNPFLPHNFTSSNCVVYTGTHDNDTTVGWFLSDHLTPSQRWRIKKNVNQEDDNPSTIHKDLIYLAMASIGRLTIFPLQDILGFGNDCKMNSPGTSKGNWTWRCAPRFLTESLSSWLRAETDLFGRCAEKAVNTLLP
ncbi:MAG: 4-alpha-glucanotransferase [Desulfocapsaceae bacterium]|nr:4-alpha-glucanotransferase [Desulfocapsaceae bacterium]